MAASLQKFREIVFQVLYSSLFEKAWNEGTIALIMRQNAISKKAALEASKKVDEILLVQEDLDRLIHAKAISYEIERLHRVELTVLRLGFYELIYTNVPPKVAIAESVRLTRKYATAEAAGFVNALLDAFYKEVEHATVSRE